MVDTTASRRFFFIHVMKTAGTTLAWHLREQFPKAAIYPSRGYDWDEPGDVESYASIPLLLEIPEDRRAQIHMFTGHFPYWVSEEVGTDLLKFTVLRDPVDRTVSVLKHFKRLGERFHDLELEAIYEDEEIQSYWIRNHQTKVFSLVPSDDARTIMRPITIDDERFERARHNLERVDIIGLTETFDDFLAELRQRWGWWPEGVNEQGRVNSSPESWGVSTELRERIAADNPYDLALYEFAQTLIVQRRGVG